jgi:hypothetical protein
MSRTHSIPAFAPPILAKLFHLIIVLLIDSEQARIVGRIATMPRNLKNSGLTTTACVVIRFEKHGIFKDH